MSKKIFEYEKQFLAQTQEIDRLNLTLKRMIDEINYAEVKLKNNEKELDNRTKLTATLEAELEKQQ